VPSWQSLKGSFPGQPRCSTTSPRSALDIIGPFENDGRAGLLAAYPPEKEGYDPKAVYRGKEHDVTWRALPSAHAPYGFIDLAGAIYPRSDVAVYAATVLRSGQAQAAFFTWAQAARRECG